MDLNEVSAHTGRHRMGMNLFLRTPASTARYRSGPEYPGAAHTLSGANPGADAEHSSQVIVWNTFMPSLVVPSALRDSDDPRG